MTAPTEAAQTRFDFLAESLGKRVIVETSAQVGALQVERFGGALEEVYEDSLLLRPDNGRRVLIYKHAIVSVTEA